MIIYADNAATTKISKTAAAVMIDCFQNFYGNPSSLYSLGQKAKELLEPLGNYQEAEESIKQIDAAFEEYEEQKILGRYNEACRLLEEGEYLGARDAFLALGSYKDSVEMAKEALTGVLLKLLLSVKRTKPEESLSSPVMIRQSNHRFPCLVMFLQH